MILFIDFEASSLLPNSFPIEIAWVDESGQGETHLIKPHEDWLNKKVRNGGWSVESEAIHGISLATLIAHGAPAACIADRVAAVFGASNVILCSDAPAFDENWLETLLNADGIRKSPRIVDARPIYGEACRPLQALFPTGLALSAEQAVEGFRDLAMDIVARAEEAEAVRPGPRHRALPDAESLWRTWRTIRTEVAQRLEGGLP